MHADLSIVREGMKMGNEDKKTGIMTG